MQRLVTLCEQTSKPFRTIPHFQSLLNGQAALSQLRPVCIDDLLGRDPVTLNWLAIRRGLAKRVVLVTGAGGSIGSELCRQLVSAEPARLIMVDHSEFNLYQLEREFVARYPDFEFSAQLLDVTDRAGVEALFQRERPQTIFHAAAYKHVPLLQDQVRGAVRNNVLGTQIVTDCADRFGSERFVLISTDKAVNPVNIMGATKRVAELLCQQRSKQSKTDYVTVRFGNVLGSAGSVVPLFQKQIEQGGPVTVTHPEIERYFMTIPEACQLIMQASVMGQHSEIFVLDMGRPIKIRQLAEQMIRLAGLEPGRDIEVQYVGLRPGEKQSEELFYDNEDMLATSHAKIQMARQNADDWDQALEAACAMLDDRDRFALLGSLGDLVPDLATISKHAPTLRALKGEAQVVPLPGRFN